MTSRRAFLKAVAASSAAAAAPSCLWEAPMAQPARMPVLFAGHGSPMHAIEDNVWSRGFASLATDLSRPKAILAISAHWETDGPATTGNPRPKTIHDFGGFPQALFDVQYPAPGQVELAGQVADLTSGRVRTDWGLDHGTWSVLRRMYPNADVPVVQLSIDRRRSFAEHLALGRALAPLRDEGILVFGTGNLTHNLRDAFGRMRSGDGSTPSWAARIDEAAAQALQEHDPDALVALGTSEAFRQAHPSAEHWIPILYAAGAAHADDPVAFPIEGFDWGSLSMRAVRLG